MDFGGGDQSKTYQVKLESGRLLGPLDLPRIAKLIQKDQITGDELACELPVGEWKKINQFPEIFELLVKKMEGRTVALAGSPSPSSFEAGTPASLPGATVVLSSVNLSPILEAPPSAEVVISIPEPRSEVISEPVQEEATMVGPKEDLIQPEIEEEKTMMGIINRSSDPIAEDSGESQPALIMETQVGTPGSEVPFTQESTLFIKPDFQMAPEITGLPSQGPQAPPKSKLREVLVAIALACALGYFGYDSFLSEPEKPVVTRQEPIRPKLPEYKKGKSDPSKSIQVYSEALRYYLSDTVTGYRIAADKLRQSISFDENNVKALAMLASSYINLIDSSNKDENYFDVLSKLIEMSRAKAIVLPETVIADVEFYIVVNKPEAAQNRIIEYTKMHEGAYGLEMFYYLALAFYSRGDAVNAARYLAQFPDNKVFSAKIFYLKGQVAEKLQDLEAALREYSKAIKFNPDHVKSRLRIAAIMNQQHLLKNASVHLDFCVNHIALLSPDELGQAYFLHSQLMSSQQNWEAALGDIERAVKLDPENHAYLLEMYSLKAKSGTSIKMVQNQARMYFFLGEGEKLIQQGRYQEAIIPFLQAREADDSSPLPPVKMGDMFNYLHDVENAKKNYKLAADRSPENIQIWSKYIKTLIQSFEWDEASKAMDRFRKLPVSQSAIDKAAADMYQQQGRFVEAQLYYKKAMARPSIDPEVYIAYAKSLMSTRNFKDAPFFFAIAQRFDPLNVDAVINTARCVAETESIEHAISMLQDELKESKSTRAEYLAAIAELQMQKGNWEEAQENISQAIRSNPDYAYSWKLMAQVYMNRENTDRDALNRALQAFKSFSERNLSDPSGYLERYKIFVKKTDFEKAKEELNKIFEIYPKYPNLHYYLGALYALQGNHKNAVEEFKVETTNNPLNFQAILAYGKELLELNEVNANREALSQFTKAMQMSPKSADAKQSAGWANYKLKNFTAAIALIREATILDQANPALYKRLGIVFRDMGDTASACASFKKYLAMEPDASDRSSFQSCL